jgi:hypothetical protein
MYGVAAQVHQQLRDFQLCKECHPLLVILDAFFFSLDHCRHLPSLLGFTLSELGWLGSGK